MPSRSRNAFRNVAAAVSRPGGFVVSIRMRSERSSVASSRRAVSIIREAYPGASAGPVSTDAARTLGGSTGALAGVASRRLQPTRSLRRPSRAAIWTSTRPHAAVPDAFDGRPGCPRRPAPDRPDPTGRSGDAPFPASAACRPLRPAPAGGTQPGGHDLGYWRRVAPLQVAWLRRTLA